VANLTLGQPDFPVPEAVRLAATDAIASGENGYSPPAGFEPLRHALKSRIESELGRPVGGVLITAGVSGGLRTAFRTLLSGGDDVLVFEPYFPPYIPLIRHAGASPVLVDTHPDFRPTAARLRAALTSKTTAVLLNSPANPTGVTASFDEVAAVVDFAREHDLWLISDEIYADFCYEGRHVSPAALYDKTILLRGFSKSHAMTGWRIGYAAGPADVIRDMTDVQFLTDLCPPTPFQHAALVASRTPTAENTRIFDGRRRMVAQLLGRHFRVAAPQGAFYCFVRAPRDDGDSLVLRALDCGVAVFPGSWFSRRRSHIRLSFCASIATLEQGCRGLIEACRL
jgi:aspartate/methionine/tyrosine aminotransferase